MATVARDNIGLLNDKITIKVSKEDYFPSFEKKLKEYSKTVNMPGFRKGMVPAGLIKKMYGPSIFTDEVLKTVEKELYTYLETEKPEIFAQPLALDADIRSMDVNNPDDYEFGFEIGLKPAFEIAPLGKAKITMNKVNVTDEMLQEEVSGIQAKGGKVNEVEAIESDETEIAILFAECEKEGTIIEEGIQKEVAVLLKDFSSAGQKQLKGKKKEDTLIIQLSKALEEDKLDIVLNQLGLEKDDKTAAKKFFQLTIVKIAVIEKRELDEAFFKEVFPGTTIATEEEFRNKLKQEIEQYWDGQSRNQLHDQLYHYLLDDTKIEFPAEFLKRWLQTGSEQRKTAQQAEEEYPTFCNQLKWTLISDKLIKENDLQVKPEELKASMRAEVMRYFSQMSIMGDDTSWLDTYVDQMMKDEKQVDATYRRLITDNLFKYVESQVKPAEKLVTVEELAAMQHHH
ncbi:MAG: trigger factor [Chitinophagia bacterium]|jgi:trigger factor|nr:trigger factor [Chitinophagia bacterium]